MKKFVCLFIILCLALPLWGCYDNQEIDKSAYVIALGIDEGQNDYIYTFQISSPLAMGGGGETVDMGEGNENTRVENIIIGAKNLYEARDEVNNFLSKKLNMSHLKIIVISDAVMTEGLKPHMPFLLREREVRPNTRLCVSEGSAETFLKGINPALEANTAEYYDLVFENGSVFAPSKALWEFVNEEETFSSALPFGKVADYKESSEFSEAVAPKRISTSKSEFSGLCLIDNYKLVGFLSPTQSKFFGLITGAIKETDISILKDGNYVTVKLFPDRKGKFSVTQNDSSINIILKMSFTAEVNALSEDIREDEIEKYLCQKAYSLLKEAQSNGCDIFSIGNCLKKQCKTISEWESLNWDELFQNAYFLPEIDVNISKTDIGPA